MDSEYSVALSTLTAVMLESCGTPHTQQLMAASTHSLGTSQLEKSGGRPPVPPELEPPGALPLAPPELAPPEVEPPGGLPLVPPELEPPVALPLAPPVALPLAPPELAPPTALVTAFNGRFLVDRVVLDWSMNGLAGLQGFNILRSTRAGGPFYPVLSQEVPVDGLDSSFAVTDRLDQRSTPRTPSGQMYYRLELNGLDGTRTLLDPIAVDVSGFRRSAAQR